jgi:hypothetical protein
VSKLKIGRGLQLPEDAVTQTFAILAKRGVGKTYTASVMTEELLKAHLPVVAIDPIGVWWGLRHSADGKSEGLPIVVFGGDHGDAPLEKGAGEVLADLVVDERFSCVLDLSSFRKGEQIRFMTDFAERLYRRNREPLHLMLDEADSFAPQKTMRGEGAERLLGAIEDLVRISPVRVSKAQLATLVGMKVTGGTYQTYFSKLRREGLIVEGGDRLLEPTDHGFTYLGDTRPAPLTQEEVVETWRRSLKRGARRMLDVLLEVHPDWISKDELGERLGMEPSGGTFNTYVSTLRRNGLAEVQGGEVCAGEALFVGVA